MTLDKSTHPCFNADARATHGRIHLPIAPRCNIQCNFCNRDFDCAVESRPGVTSAILTPLQAVRYLDKALERDPRIAVVGIAGPGDPFANPNETMETLRLVRKKYPDILLCVATNGLGVGPYIDELAKLQVSHMTITICAVDPAVGQEVYSWVRYGKRVRRSREAAEILIEKQLDAVRRFANSGVTLKVNSVLVPGVNDHHISEIARTVGKLGADIFNCIPLYPVAGSNFEGIESPPASLVQSVREAAGEFLPQMMHCGRCRADAVGLLGQAMAETIVEEIKAEARGEVQLPIVELSSTEEPFEETPSPGKTKVAVATMEGVLVNRHLGETDVFHIYEPTAEGPEFVETRQAPLPGGGDQRWNDLADVLSDCQAVLVSGVGAQPKAVLRKQGIRVVPMEGLILEGLEAVFSGNPIRSPLRCGKTCGAGCSGTGTGCG